MDSSDNKLSEIVDKVTSWIPRRMEPVNVSRDFWMPDQSCRVCYECDSQFTIFNRRHHCRLCGRVFCARCTSNSIPAPTEEGSRLSREDRERIRVCNYCFKQWEQQGVNTVDNGMAASSPGLSPSPSAASLVSSHSSCTCNSGSSDGSTPYSTGPYQHVPYNNDHSPRETNNQIDKDMVEHYQTTSSAGKSSSVAAADPLIDQYGLCNSARNSDEDKDYGIYRLNSELRHFSPPKVLYGNENYKEISHNYSLGDLQSDGDKNETNRKLTLPSENTDVCVSEITEKFGKETEGLIDIASSEIQSSYDVNPIDAEPLDYENNGLLWLPPEPEDEEDEQEAIPSEEEEDDDDRDVSTGEWGYLRSSGSFGGGEHHNRHRSIEEHRNTMKMVLDGHFRSLISQLLQDENLPLNEEDGEESWLEIVMSLSWEVASLLKPDMSKSGGMDPGGYVKVKCIACGRRCESTVVKGVVCKKNVAHRRMTSKVEKPRLCILGGALEYQRVANHLSSFDTLLQQEMDHLKMAVAKIDAHHPNVLLVEKSVSRFAQEYLLAKDISLVLNIKRPLLERISRCTGAQIVPSVDHLNAQKLGFCELFHVEKFVEEHGSAGQGGKKLTKTLMFFEGCPKPLGFTILLKGANGDELKKVKRVLQYGVFAAYHLALETSFLADEGASLLELPLKAPIKVALPDKPNKSTSTIREFTSAQDNHAFKKQNQSGNTFLHDNAPSISCSPSQGHLSLPDNTISTQTLQSHLNSVPTLCLSRDVEEFCGHYDTNKEMIGIETPDVSSIAEPSLYLDDNGAQDNLISDCCCDFVALGKGACPLHGYRNPSPQNSSTLNLVSLDPDSKGQYNEVDSLNDEFSPSASDNQSILVSLMSRCVWKASVCERAHLFRIKYYGTFDKPLGRFLLEQLFDQNYRCPSCQMPSEAHIRCYTHQQGSVTISVKKLPEVFLPGEQKRKIWMWHRCLKCPRTDGFPPTTKRKLMSDAAWGLSFGKVLELCFSNHAAANRVASCGHSLHRDCLRFYGLGSMVACFYYAPINVHTVHLPPPKLEFNYDFEEWIRTEADEVRRRAEQLFSEVVRSLHQISESIPVHNGDKAPVIQQLEEMEVTLEKEKREFEVSLHQVIGRTVAAGQPVDILEINRLRRQLIIQAYVWDQRLVQFCNFKDNNLHGISRLIPKVKEKAVSGQPPEIVSTSKPSKSFSSCDSFLQNLNPEVTFNQGGNGNLNSSDGNHGRNEVDQGSNYPHDAEVCNHSVTHVDKECDPENVKTVRRVLSEGQFSNVKNLSDSLDAAWTGEGDPVYFASKRDSFPDPAGASNMNSTLASQNIDSGSAQSEADYPNSSKGSEIKEQSNSWVTMPLLALYHSFVRNSMVNEQKLDMISSYNPVYILSLKELLHQGCARLLLREGIHDIILPVYDDEPTSVIAFALTSPDYHDQMISDPINDGLETSSSLPILESENLLSLPSLDVASRGSLRSPGSANESISSPSVSRSSTIEEHQFYSNQLHVRVSFSDDGPLGKVKYSVTCYFAKQFEALRRTCCPSELDFIRSLSRCKKWGAQGGKSNVFFAKTLDDRFIIKQVTKTELESFLIFGPAYFKYLSDSLRTGSPTCLAKILGIYQVTSKHLKGGKESKMDVLVMENLLFKRNITRLYDLKGSARSRYNSDSSGNNKVLLDQNLLEAMPTSPIFVGTKAKRLLERAVWNDTAFLASIDVMDYSLLVGMDEEKHELVLGIIDFMRQYTWDKHLETWVKASGILGGPKNATPTVISPIQYKRRFRKAMSGYFLMVPDQWSSSSTNISSELPSEPCEENHQT
ncbi:OLC1v1033745C1 [Oldenlandia corymbosa var. corymbosa]|uniref:1-phosphatidylinositol-3-phosphate 5-kinase n=1 Tax=Oldenlandia corymbosa var. corymbosa TaxID=529605 RepID=A0AAV1CP21_OLDCO|nr:OLC1v1033745C1 [Oldenlandia corymbosa var. corymbosa]